ncbi:glutamyl-tRNA amidotransferase [Candidatus Kaiserbacteria bacterium CG10_big_fil_rev_8_21_14_0_10_59_10]|uniref:Glutamyl-tRNA amidotransferase n=1 Tax=Candidatus Kaiserbacteria bacterium CG10_big_fil_rev_8_21_14_0_10_59_10 TaxID=1974612 RepID=A0A2H0U796_9BACT|nr:MAG: glutamyl-tRNA amidotransferase [Candidatus Kaiserbacteria bacterium CG10_big_fil_rev_8_21_14_0_10_59_10]
MITADIRAAMVAAMRSKDALRVDTLRGALAAFTNELVAKGRKPTEELSDAEAVTVLKRLAKQRKESAESYEKGGRAELADKERAELAIVEEYLPQMASRDEIERVARAKKDELRIADASGAGKLTGAGMKELGGNADGNEVKEAVQRILSQ